MNQTKLQDFEKKRLGELYERNGYSSALICDFPLADKMKRMVEENGNK